MQKVVGKIPIISLKKSQNWHVDHPPTPPYIPGFFPDPTALKRIFPIPHGNLILKSLSQVYIFVPQHFVLRHPGYTSVSISEYNNNNNIMASPAWSVEFEFNMRPTDMEWVEPEGGVEAVVTILVPEEKSP